MEAVVERENLKKALAQVKRNKGAAGVDGMTVGELPAYLKEHWPTIRDQLLDGTYKPQPGGASRYRKRQAACDRSAFPRCSIASSSKRRCRCCKRIGTEHSPRQASAFDRGARRIRRWNDPHI
jgi:hypothetical protein